MIKCKIIKLNVQHFRLLLLLVIITALSFTTSIHAKDRDYPGKLVDIGTHRLHINCVGEGTPSVIIDSGIGGFSLEWIKIQKSLADNVRVCSYDRAGYGWSDPGPTPRTTARIARELKTLLSEANISAPYLLVGHSFGGYNIRYFASEYPELTAGLVLIDSSHPEQFNTEEFKRVVSIPRVENSVKRKNSIRVRMVYPIIANNYPQENKRVASVLMMTMKSKSTLMNELDYMDTSAKQVAERANHPPYKFPVVIITRGKRVWPDNELGDRREQQWTKLQNDLENISIKSDHFHAYNSGHIIHLDQPELVSKNILLAVNKSRAQILEHELIDKFDIRLANYSTIPSFGDPYTSFNYNATDLNKYSIFNKSDHHLLFDSKSRYIENHSTYFLH